MNVASRVEKAGKDLLPDAEVAVLLSAATAEAVGTGGPALRSMGECDIRGREAPVELFAASTDDDGSPRDHQPESPRARPVGGSTDGGLA